MTTSAITALKRVLSGEWELSNVPEGMRDAVRNLYDFQCYKRAVDVIGHRTREKRADALNAQPPHMRPLIEAWARKLFQIRITR